jgi:hypothetical protein
LSRTGPDETHRVQLGFFFLGELQEYVRQQKMETQSKADEDLENKELEFTYNLGEKFKST